MNNERIETLIEEAFAARKMAYTPYSHFQVGAVRVNAASQRLQLWEARKELRNLTGVRPVACVVR